MRVKLWFARTLRLTSLAIFIIVIAQWTLLTLGLGFAWSGVMPPPPFQWSLPLDLALIPVILVLGIVGDKISPPDPWLDSWLNPFRGYKPRWKRAEPPPEEGQVWATISFVEKPGYVNAPDRLEPGGRCFVEFDDGFMFLGQPGKELVQIEPKKILQASSNLLDLDTGHWGNGQVTLAFDSASDADKIKKEVEKLVLRKISLGYRQIPPTFPEQN